ncbi:MAG TPA: hypothetical protein VIL83_08120 [Capillibacterium sp.]
MKLKLEFKRDTNYYFGLALLVVASASIIWAFFFDGFEPEDFLVYFLIYAWGYTLLLKSDTEYRLDRLEKAVTALQRGLDQLTAGPLVENQDQQGETGDEEEGVNTDDAESMLAANTTDTDPTATVSTSARESQANAEPEATPETTGDA